MLAALHDLGFDVMTRNHAEAILERDFPDEVAELVGALRDVSVPVEELIASGGGEAASTQRLRRALSDTGWKKHSFEIVLLIDGVPKDAVTHEIDHVRYAAAGTIALEIEWNNKDPFFDRDLENFQRLHGQSVIDVGVIVTRGQSLHDSVETLVTDFLRRSGIRDATELEGLGMKKRTDRQEAALSRKLARGEDFAAAFARTFVADKYGEATTHWRKLAERVRRGVGNPCPLLLLGLPASIVKC